MQEHKNRVEKTTSEGSLLAVMTWHRSIVRGTELRYVMHLLTCLPELPIYTADSGTQIRQYFRLVQGKHDSIQFSILLIISRSPTCEEVS